MQDNEVWKSVFVQLLEQQWISQNSVSNPSQPHIHGKSIFYVCKQLLIENTKSDVKKLWYYQCSCCFYKWLTTWWEEMVWNFVWWCWKNHLHWEVFIEHMLSRSDRKLVLWFCAPDKNQISMVFSFTLWMIGETKTLWRRSKKGKRTCAMDYMPFEKKKHITICYYIWIDCDTMMDYFTVCPILHSLGYGQTSYYNIMTIK